MALISIDELDSVGLIKDQSDHRLPPEALTIAENVRFRNRKLEKLLGYEQVFGTPGVAPHFLLPVQSASQVFWLYTSLTKGYVYDGTSHTNITRQTMSSDVDYNASNTRDWNGALLASVPILNNGVDDPQYWSALSTGTKLADLANWPANTTAKIIRALGPHLIAFNVTDGGTVFPHMVLWSHPADPGSVPSSWDHTDSTVDAGRKDLPDINAGIIREALPLRSRMIIYKEASTWAMRHIGGRFIFEFDTILETVGILAERCVGVVGDGRRHLVATQDDLIVHDGAQAESVLDQRDRRSVFNAIDTDNFNNSFMFENPDFNEIWFCFPESGSTHPNRAVVWNYKQGRLGVLTEARNFSFRNAAVGNIENPTTETWDSVSGSWNDSEGQWSDVERRRVVACSPDDTKFFKLDETNQRDGVNFDATVQRTGLSVVGRKRNGEWVVDHEAFKFVRRLWPRLSGSTVRVRVGFQNTLEGAVSWGDFINFDPSVDLTVDFIGSGRAVAVEFSSTGNDFWTLDGYQLDVTKGGTMVPNAA